MRFPPNFLDSTSEAIKGLSILESVRLRDAGLLPRSGLCVLVGPNSSGKTLLLREIADRLVAQPRELVVAESLTLSKPSNFDQYIALVEQSHIYESRTNPNGSVQLLPNVPRLGLNSPAPSLDPILLRRYLAQWQPHNGTDKPPEGTGTQEFLSSLGPLLVTTLFLANRLSFPFESPSYDYEVQKPTNELQTVFSQTRLQSEFSKEMSKAFGRAAWLDGTRGSVICVRVSDSASPPSAEDRLNPWQMRTFRMLAAEGDGMRSFAAICLSLLPSRRPVCVLDEPENCLHPPQAYAIGNFIGRHAAASHDVTFVATHSSHVLRGIVDSAAEVTIVRLRRSRGTFVAHKVLPHSIATAIRNPAIRAEQVLDGIFADAVVIVEAEGDRLVYGTAFEVIREEINRDCLFIPTGGTGGLADMATFYSTMGVPASIIADIDLLVDIPKLERVLAAICPDQALVDQARTSCRGAVASLRGLQPDKSPEDARSRLSELAQSDFTWEAGDANVLIRKLRQVLDDLDPRVKFKATGVSSFEGKLREQLEGALEACASCGLFLVPVGELESWASSGIGEGPKKLRAHQISSDIRKSRDSSLPVCQFVYRAASFALREMSSSAHSSDHEC